MRASLSAGADGRLTLVPTPPMLRGREPEPGVPGVAGDPVASLTVVFLGVIAVALFVAAILAVYTYSTPGVEVPLVVAIALVFGVVVVLNVLSGAVRLWRALRE